VIPGEVAAEHMWRFRRVTRLETQLRNDGLDGEPAGEQTTTNRSPWRSGCIRRTCGSIARQIPAEVGQPFDILGVAGTFFLVFLFPPDLFRGYN
jgi:hypothetical protein